MAVELVAYDNKQKTRTTLRIPPDPPRRLIVTDATHTTAARDQAGSTLTATPDAVIGWLQSEFPGWQFSVDETATWEGEPRQLWIARRGGHHPQSELSAAKLHTRLTEYLEREARRTAHTN